MVIGSGKEDAGDWEERDATSTGRPVPSSPVKPSKLSDAPPQATKPSAPTPTISQKAAEKTPEKPVKIEKQPEKPASPKKELRTPQSFDHIFQLTQGNLENSGLVVINGATGSGRTTLCSGLTGNYMKMGNPCLYVTYDQAPSSLRDQMKKLGTDASQYESQFRFILIDGFASQSESFSLEPYYLEQPFAFDNIQDTLVRNVGIFAGEKIRVIIDSLDKLAGKVSQKEFTKSFGDLANKLKVSGATFIVTVDLSALPKDLAGSLTDMADCVVDLAKDAEDPNGRQLQVQRLNQKSSKIDPETFEIDSNKGLVFV
jgi:KaiC/GvpD/RAD55 family RecA-like ATPase